jgi:homoserine O-succinyltransferase
VIGLVNSMPGEARRHTEQQFRDILSAAVSDVPVELRFFSLEASSHDRAHAGAHRASGRPHYDDMATLEAAAPDGLIVTGMPPRAASLTDEPYWPKLTELVDFATDAEIPTVWSCLAAHAAVLYLDGIERQRLPQKLLGLVDCTRTEAEHPIMGGLPWRWQMPHSRYNDLPEQALATSGYRVLSRSAVAGADIFVRETGPLFLFCQGHPEYDAHTLLREYRRDVRQFLTGERDTFPAEPDNYFGPEVSALLAGFRNRALRKRRIDMFEAFPMDACAAELRHAWRNLAIGLYANWLTHVAERKMRRAEGGGVALTGAAARLADMGAAPPLGAAAE